jgi:biotin carboxylase
MPRVLLLLPTSTYRADAFLEAARTLGVEVTLGLERTAVLLDRPQYDWLSLNFSEPARSIEAVLQYARECPVHAVLGVDDSTVILAAQISEALGLPHNPVEAVTIAKNKFLMRERLRAHGVPVPHFSRYSIEDDPAAIAEHVRYPCVVKPLILSASCGVIRADTPQELTAAFRRVAGLLHKLGMTAGQAGRELLVEDFVPGREVALEGLMADGALRVLAIFDKPDPLNGPFFEETLYVTPSRLPSTVQADIGATTERAARAIGLCEGPIHTELRVNDHGVWLIEVAARSIGGRCSRTVRFAAGLSLETVILRQALRMDLPSLQRDGGAAGVMMLPIPQAGILRRVRGEQDARLVEGIEDVTITAEIGQTLVPLPEGTRYLGFVIARGSTADAVEAALREAHRRLDFSIEPAEPNSAETTADGGCEIKAFRF